MKKFSTIHTRDEVARRSIHPNGNAFQRSWLRNIFAKQTAPLLAEVPWALLVLFSLFLDNLWLNSIHTYSPELNCQVVLHLDNYRKKMYGCYLYTELQCLTGIYICSSEKLLKPDFDRLLSNINRYKGASLMCDLPKKYDLPLSNI